MSVDEAVLQSAVTRRPRRFFARRHWRRWLIAAVAFLGVAYFAAPWLYIHVFSEPAPPPLSFEQLDKEREANALAGSNTGTTAAVIAVPSGTEAIDGTWTVTAPSSAGYRVEESIAGQAKTAVGRTSTVDGTFTIAGGQVTAAEVNVDLASMVSDEARRDAQFQGRIMATDEFPVATFTLTDSFVLSSSTAVEGVLVKGTLSLHGAEHPATFTVSGKLEGDSITLVASTVISFADYDIPNPNIGPVSTDDHGTIEVALTAKR
jgi:polyisoprenoid-binding protein YceI